MEGGRQVKECYNESGVSLEEVSGSGAMRSKTRNCRVASICNCLCEAYNPYFR